MITQFHGLFPLARHCFLKFSKPVKAAHSPTKHRLHQPVQSILQSLSTALQAMQERVRHFLVHTFPPDSDTQDRCFPTVIGKLSFILSRKASTHFQQDSTGSDPWKNLFLCEG